MASRIHGDVYVRFRGRYAETCRRKAVRRCIPSLQTNLQQVRPEIYAKLEEQCAVKLPVQDGEIFSFPALDAMIENNAWVCPIMPEKQVIFFRITLTHI